MRIALAAVALAAAVATPASGQEPERCTRIGCDSGVTVDLTKVKRAAQATVCINAKCRRFRRLSDAVHLRYGRPGASRRVTVRVVIFDRRGRRVMRVARRVRLQRLQPNGPNCPPVCWARRLRLEPNPGRLVAI